MEIEVITPTGEEVALIDNDIQIVPAGGEEPQIVGPAVEEEPQIVTPISEEDAQVSPISEEHVYANPVVLDPTTDI